MSRPKRVLTLEQEEEIVRRFDVEPIISISKALGIPRVIISGVLSSRGILTARYRNALTPSQEADIVRRAKEGESALSMSREFDVDNKTIGNILHRNGVITTKGRRKQFESHQEWRQDPRNRLRILMQGARSGAEKRGLFFEQSLLDAFPNPPKQCSCCGCLLDYAIHPRKGKARDKSPSLDRRDNSVGYTVSNVRITCYRCNKIKNALRPDDLRMLLAYVEDVSSE